jgi:tetratricopeptide (TPR) repeat protein
LQLESLLLALIGGGIGVTLAVWDTSVLLAASPRNLLDLRFISMDLHVLGFAIVATLLTGLLFWLSTFLHLGTFTYLGDSQRSSFVRLIGVDLGFEAKHIPRRSGVPATSGSETSGEQSCEIILPMKATIAVIPRILLVLSAFLAPLLAQTPGTQQQQPEFIRQGQQLMREGKLDDALALYRKTLQTLPNSVPANIAAGSVLDLKGQGEEGRKYFAKAIEIADTSEHKAMAQRAMAISYAFEGNCGETVEYEKQVFEYYGNAKNFFQQGEIADEAARVCIDSDDLDVAYYWYQLGHDTGLKEPDIKPARQDLWDFRWEHAQARIAARRGNQAEAQKHVAAANSILDKGTNPEQAQFLPYLKGYVAYYGKEYKTALDELLKANQNDPFIQCMIGQTYEKLDDKDKAIEFYRRASTAIAHNPPAAYAVPFTKKKLASLSN